jgi:Ricin-type beta-trefoil lectin domain-like
VTYRIPVIFICGCALAAEIVWPQARGGGFEGPGRYVISNAESHLVLELDRLNHKAVIQSSVRERDSQRWDIERAGPELFYLRNAENGRALDASGDRSVAICARFNAGTSQQWRLEAAKEGTLQILSSDGRALELPESLTIQGARLQIDERTGRSNQRFILRRVNKPPKEY